MLSNLRLKIHLWLETGLQLGFFFLLHMLLNSKQGDGIITPIYNLGQIWINIYTALHFPKAQYKN